MALNTANDGNMDFKREQLMFLSRHIKSPNHIIIHLPSSLENVNIQRVNPTV